MLFEHGRHACLHFNLQEAKKGLHDAKQGGKEHAKLPVSQLPHKICRMATSYRSDDLLSWSTLQPCLLVISECPCRVL